MNTDTIPHRAPRIASAAERELAKAKRAIEYFLFACSGSIREPLQEIGKLCEMIKGRQDIGTNPPFGWIEDVLSQVSKMESVLNEQHQFLSHAHQTITIRSIDPDALLKSIMTEFQSVMLRENIHFTMVMDQPVAFYTDRSSLRLIITQLISNAVKFSDPSKTRMEIGIIVRVTQRHCRVVVTDNGVGVSEDIRPNIYDLFFKGDPDKPGSGVGLFVVKELVSGLGGEIQMTSREGEGSEFSFEIDNLWVENDIESGVIFKT